MKEALKDKAAIRILHLEDSDDDSELLLRHLKKRIPDFLYERVEFENDFARNLEEKEWDIILSDYSVGPINALVALALVRKWNVRTPFFVLSGSVTDMVATEAMRLGARGCFSKDNLDPLVPAIYEALQSPSTQTSQHSRTPNSFLKASPSLVKWLDAGQIAQIEELESEGSDFLRLVLGLFLREAPQQIEKIKAAAASSDFDTLRKESHSLAGGAAGIGAVSIQKLAREIEAWARKPETKTPPRESLLQLESECAGLCSALNIFLA